MRVFMTGATGFIGSEAARELKRAGHTVTGLARNDAAAAKLEAAGVEPHRGALEAPDSLAEAARSSDAVIHLGFIHDFTRYQENVATDRRALEALADALKGSGKPLVAAFGLAGFAPGRPVVETDAPLASHPFAIRGANEAVLDAAAADGVRAMVLRLPPTVHGEGDGGFVPRLVEIARERGASGYVGEGANRWSAVHRSDAARLIGLALERGEPAARLHAVAEEGVATRRIAETVAEGLGLPARSIPAAEAGDWFGWLGGFLGVDAAAASAVTRERLGWEPREPGLLEDMRAHYFG